MQKTIMFRLNGQKRHVDVQSHEVLLDVLREKMGIKSPKIGCDKGDCGSCTVLLNGRSVRSCLILAVEVDGMDVETLEGITRDGLTPLQQSLLKHNAFQCGFCAPGIITTATELLRNNPSPSEKEIKEAISGNLCRCTGYTPIIDAIMDEGARKKCKD